MMRHRSDLFESFQSGDVVVAGVSGGADSVCMLHQLAFGRVSLQITVCHLNHTLRGEESERDSQFVQNLCGQWKLPLQLRTLDIRAIAAQHGLSLEEAGRNERYQFFEQTADSLSQSTGKTVWIATAHTRSDNAETMLFHLTRGTGLRGLCGIPKQRNRIVRPLLTMTREEVEIYCQKHALSYVTDSSNVENTYSRNRIRNEVIPVLKQINPAMEHTLAQTAELLSQENALLETLTQESYEQVVDAELVNGERLNALHPALAARVLHQYLQVHHIPASFKKVQQLEQLRKEGGVWNICKDWFVREEQGNLRLFQMETKQSYFEQPFKIGEYLSKTGVFYKVQTLETIPSTLFHKIYKNLFDISIDCGKILGSVVIRQKIPGDQVKLRGRNHTKSLKKWFQEEKVPAQERLCRFVVADEQGVIAVEGLGVAQRVACDEQTRKRIEMIPMRGKSNDER